MAEHKFLVDAVVFLAAAVTFVVLSRRIRVDPIVGYLAAGILVGPNGLALISDVASTRALGELGVVFLLFSIGLELSVQRLKVLRSQVFGLGTAQVVISGALIGTAAWALGVKIEAAIVVGAGLAMSSTAVVLQLLSQRGEIAGRVGRIAFSILLLQDLAVVPFLAAVPLLGSTGPVDWAALAAAAGTAIAAVAAIIVVGRLLLRPIFRAIAAGPGPEVFVALTLLSVLGAGLAAEVVGLSLTLGAFLAGLLLSETEFRHQVDADIRPFRGLLLGLFFMTIGMSIDLRLIGDHWDIIAMLSVALILTKAIVLAGLCRVIALPWPLALRAGLLLSQGGEFAFLLIAGAMAVGVLPPTVAQICLIVVSATIAATPGLAGLGRWLASRLERQAAIRLAAVEEENLDLRDHVIIAGFGRVGQTMARLLDARRIPYVVLDTNPENVREGRYRGTAIHYGDASRPELLWAVGADRAKAVVITISDPDVAMRVVTLLRQKLPQLAIVVRAQDWQQAEALQAAGASAIVPEALETSVQLGIQVLRAIGLPEEDVMQVVGALRTGGDSEKARKAAE